MNILGDLINSMIMFGVPLLLVALGGMFTERGGVINIALEGVMIIGGLAACLFLRAADLGGWGQSAPQLAMLLAILVAGAVGILFSLLLAFAAINLKADQVIGGTALNIFAPAFAIILTWAIQGQGQTTINLPKWLRIGRVVTENDGFLYRVLFKNFYLTTIVAVVLFILAIVVLYKTRFGLRLRSCGEHPSAADSVGINVYKMRYAGTAISGFLAGIGGLAFTVAAGSGFVATVAGYGFLALAVMIFGNWKPLNILGAALFFSLFKVVGSYASSIAFLPHFTGVSNSQYIYQMLPYVVTMVVLVFTSKKSRAPKSEGIPYDKGQR
ncbi:nucleoside ABC transporter membrane protein [Sporobacter termitidis DSM 10068]|uniref:Nucleoside ABC transporter membrane protein n=1 Tax=Sporobacter termitidis DSM 10068 TaxID=1123282 RepID=A0A1M5XQK6_9FIRM|nr:ABC transporter permease [Sporobacter termitidis]SHI02036.1 nucleoside ABC transporter membrane protein [Sporobacter termitidis DSM 10068]